MAATKQRNKSATATGTTAVKPTTAGASTTAGKQPGMVRRRRMVDLPVPHLCEEIGWNADGSSIIETIQALPQPKRTLVVPSKLLTDPT